MQPSRRAIVPYVLLAPGLGFLFVFFLVPIYYLGNTSLQTGDINVGYVFTWAWNNYSDALSTYRDQFVRSVEYGAIATVLCLILGYPLAYFIAIRAGRYRNLLLMLVIAPFFVTYLIRTLAWQTILADEGVVMNVLRAVGIMGDGDRILATSTAVIAGITYNFLPFMVLPLYASLEQVDLRLLDAAADLYGSPRRAFLKVTLPLSLPGVFAGTLLTFIPAVGDFINAALLGTRDTQMIGNVIQSKFLNITDYPAAASLSFILMIGILLMVIAYARALGAERLTG
jgi:spermidine/putrescine transport system permease protein